MDCNEKINSSLLAYRYHVTYELRFNTISINLSMFQHDLTLSHVLACI
jgi:hypothetical protein